MVMAYLRGGVLVGGRRWPWWSRSMATGRRENPLLARADMVATGVLPDAGLRISAVRTGRLAEDAARRWGWDVGLGERWGSHAAYSLMYASFLRGEERVKASLATGDGALFTECIAVGEVRGYASAHAPPASDDADGGDAGTLTVERVLYGFSQPHTSTLPASGDLQRAWQTFYDSSEQVPSFCVVETARDDTGGMFVGGITVQAIAAAGGEPAAASEVKGTEGRELVQGAAAVGRVRELWEGGHLPDMAATFREGRDGLDEYVSSLAEVASLGSVSTMTKRPLDFHCRCSKEGFAAKLASLGASQLRELSLANADPAVPGSMGGCELSCHMCNESYAFSSTDLGAIIEAVGDADGHPK